MAGFGTTVVAFLLRAGGSVPQVRRERLRHVELDLVEVTPGPALTGLEGRHNRMAGVLEMVCGVAAGRAVATADVAARQTETEMNPALAGSQALLTPEGARGNRLQTEDVFTYHKEPPPGFG
jgi:hypothetical protein